MEKSAKNIVQLNAQPESDHSVSFLAEVTRVNSGVAVEVSYQRQAMKVDYCVHGNRELKEGDLVLAQKVSQQIIVTHRLPNRDEPAEPQLTFDGEQWVLSSQSAMKLKVGRSVLTIQPSGDIAIEGRDLLSEATGTNRLLGTRIELN